MSDVSRENAGESDELLLAERFVGQYRQDLMLVANDRWFRWNGGRWVADEGAHWTRREMARCLERYAILSKFDAKERRRMLSNRMVRECLALAADRLYRSDVRFDEDPDIAGLPDGRLVDLRSGRIRNTSRLDYVSLSLGVIPEPGKCPLFERFIKATSIVRGNNVKPRKSYTRTLRRHTSDATLIARSIV